MKYTLRKERSEQEQEELKERDRAYYHKTRDRRLELNKQRYENNKDWFFSNNKKCVLKRKYNLSIQDLEKMNTEQAGRCFICNEEQPLCVDHCHKTNKVRKLLCGSCNRALGLFKDSPDLLSKATDYLLTHGDSH